MRVPVEILEKILLKCDGKTLITAKKVDDNWSNIVDYITQKTRIWEWCCHEEIPQNELIEYLDRYHEKDCCDNKWLSIYLNWKSWENLSNIRCDIVLSPVEVPRISCIAVSGHYIAVGSEDGRLRIFNKNWRPLYAARHLAVKITSLTFIDSNSYSDLDLCIAAAWAKGLNIFCFDGEIKNKLVLHDVVSHSIYKNYICYEKLGGRMTIAKLTNNQGIRELSEIWFSRIYSPICLSSMNMWNGTCTFLIKNNVKTLNYKAKNISPMEIMKSKTKINFSFKTYFCHTRVLKDDIIICLYQQEEDPIRDFIEIFILGEREQYKKKLFNSYEIFKCFITCVYVYGNTFIIGVDIGCIYIYHVSSWKNLDLRSYNRKLVIGQHPIISIDVRETQNERKFYVSSRFNIHEISGYVADYAW